MSVKRFLYSSVDWFYLRSKPHYCLGIVWKFIALHYKIFLSISPEEKKMIIFSRQYHYLKMGLFMPLISSKEDQDGNSATVNHSIVLKTNLMTAIENDVFKCIYKCFPSNYFSFLIALFSSFHTFDIANKLLIDHFTVVYLVAKPLIWSEAKGDLVGLETRI